MAVHRVCLDTMLLNAYKYCKKINLCKKKLCTRHTNLFARCEVCALDVMFKSGSKKADHGIEVREEKSEKIIEIK